MRWYLYRPQRGKDSKPAWLALTLLAAVVAFIVYYQYSSRTSNSDVVELLEASMLVSDRVVAKERKQHMEMTCRPFPMTNLHVDAGGRVSTYVANRTLSEHRQALLDAEALGHQAISHKVSLHGKSLDLQRQRDRHQADRQATMTLKHAHNLGMEAAGHAHRLDRKFQGDQNMEHAKAQRDLATIDTHDNLKRVGSKHDGGQPDMGKMDVFKDAGVSSSSKIRTKRQLYPSRKAK